MTPIPMTGVTSGGGAAARSLSALYASAVCVLFVVGSQPALATTSTYSVDVPGKQTDANVPAPLYSVPAQTTGEAVHELRRRSGLTWEELGDLFSVSRRSVHHWASGEVLAAKHERHVREVLNAIRQTDRGESRKTRDALLMTDDRGISALALLKAGDTEAAVTMLGGGVAPTESRTTLSTAAREARSRPRATDYLGAMDAPPIPKTGKGRVVRVHRAKR